MVCISSSYLPFYSTLRDELEARIKRPNQGQIMRGGNGSFSLEVSQTFFAIEQHKD
jgi:hypothetical protein